MKKLIYAFLSLGILAGTVSAQLKFPSTTFPIGGFGISGVLPPESSTAPRYSYLLDSMYFIGFNTYYEADFQNAVRWTANMPYNMTMYTSGTYLNHDQPDGELLNKYFVGDRSYDNPGAEQRYFLSAGPDQHLTSYYGIHSDYERIDLKAAKATPAHASAWLVITGSEITTTKGTQTFGEWQITPPNGISDPITTNLLRLKLGSHKIDPFEATPNEGGTIPNTDQGNLGVFHARGNDLLTADFIFKLNTTATNDLYTITVKIYPDENGEETGATPFKTYTIPINLAIYNANKFSVTPNTDIGGSDDYNNPPTLFRFPDVNNFTNKTYAVYRLPTENLNNGFNIGIRNDNTSPATTSTMKHEITFTLNTFHDPSNSANDNTTVPIFVRGLRLRTKRADDILSNQSATAPSWCPGCTTMAAQANHLFDEVKNSIGSNDPKHISGLTGCGELNTCCFRVLAYMDHLWHNYSKTNFGTANKNIIAFMSSNVVGDYTQYRAIYEDENQTKPPLIMEEDNFGYGKPNSGDPPFVPKDAVSSTIRSDGEWNDNNMGFPLQPNGILTLADGYTNYTNAIQGVSSSGGYLSATNSNHESSANAAYPDHSETLTKNANWNALLDASTIIGYNGHPEIYTPLSSLTGFRNTVAGHIKNGLGGDETDFYRNGPNGSGTNASILTTVNTDTHIQSSGIAVDYRAPIATELRESAWDALTWGAKGIFFNEIGSDGGPNIYGAPHL